MRKAFVFIATFVAVLIAGAAFAFMAAPSGDEDVAGADEEAIEETTTTSITHEEEKPHVEDPGEVDEAEAEEPKKKDKKKADKPVHAPEIVILYPEDGAHFTEEHLAFEGEVTPGSEVWAAGYKAEVDDEGHWRIVLILSPGGNLATFTAVNDAGESTAQVKVYLDAKDGGEDEPKDHEFTAHQKYGSCGDEVPYDIWYGTGTPGTKVWVGSDFGSNSTVIGEGGNWDLKVTFPEAPCNDEFTVVLETDDGHRKVYEFIRFCEEEDSEGEPK